MSVAPILGPLNLVDDPASADAAAKKHTPYIEVANTDEGVRVTVQVGHYMPHPNEPDHYIDWIELYAEEAPIARFDLSPVATSPTVSVIVDLEPGTVLRAVENCNLHGLWAAQVTL